MWGQDGVVLCFVKSVGIIPTRVGTRTEVWAAALVKIDHPHACGDKNIDLPSCKNDEGSSPRVWGQVKKDSQIISQNGIIPTRVGTRKIVEKIVQFLQDHPHACGDKLTTVLSKVIGVGSSPRVWGQVQKLSAKVSSDRIIPTRVGTSSISNPQHKS